MTQKENISTDSLSCEICLADISEQRQFLKICSDYNCICDECLDSWISSQIHLKDTHNKREFFFLKCPFQACNRLFDLESFLKRVKINKLPKTEKELFVNICRESSDFTNCPNSNCKNIGFLDINKTCRQNLQCEQCLYEWRLPSQKYQIELTLQSIFSFSLKRTGTPSKGPNRQKMSNLVSEFLQEKYQDIKTLFYKLLFSKTCSKCGISIVRNGGCKQMRCERCHHHFCWDCGQTINYKHQTIKCNIVQTIKISLLLSPIFLIYQKLGFFTFLKGISFIPQSNLPLIVKLGCKLPQKILGILGLFIRIFSYHFPIKIIYALASTMHKYFPNALKKLIPNNDLFSGINRRISKVDETEMSNISTKQKYLSIFKWGMLLFGNVLLLNQFGSCREVVGILGVESLLSLFLITNHLV